MEIENILLEKIIPYARNPRKNNGAVDGVVASIKEFGFQNPIIIDRNDVIVAGHTRHAAAKKLGLKTAPCIRAENLTEAQVKAYRLLDNKLAEKSEWDSEMLSLELADLSDIDFDLSGFDADFSDDIDPPEINTEDDEVPEAPKEAFSKLGDVWICGRHRVMCGDNRKDLETIFKTNRYNLLITDPPYGVSYADKNRFLNAISPANRIQEPIENDHKNETEMFELWKSCFSSIEKYKGIKASYYITAPQGGGLLLLLLLAIKEVGYKLKHMLIWSKNNHVLGRSDYHYKHEPIIYGWFEDGHIFYGDASQVSVWEVDKPLKSELHPTMKPIELFAKAIKNSSKENDIIADPFLGSGTTLIACERLNRTCYGMEIEPRYVDVICQRFYNETKQVPVRESDQVPFPVEVKDE